jgi:glucokinase
LYASAAAIARSYSARTATKATAAQVAERTAAGDPIARQVWRQAVEALAGALSTYVTICAPELVVVGGGLAESGETLLRELRVSLADRLSFQRVPRLVRAKFGDRAGQLGAALLARREAGLS